ncbi:hypothetical protein [Spiroplasma chrysopicola]|uniref:Transmembrane protein n=1 Tax=Spiroplasma chrysopicola DF-1 TaxID=1276227 RepID=R4UAN0_9MOLU|nr:hypothetical protein [Spiroplasma chrysopicola]AGM24969.1 hypothetical protein SCHRY_v1c03860 [Spiroplasma chrysopicola DF-1]
MWKNKRFITGFSLLLLSFFICGFFVIFASVNTVMMQNNHTKITGFQIFQIINNNFKTGYVSIPGFIYVIIYGSINSFASFSLGYWWTLKFSLIFAMFFAPILFLSAMVVLTKYFAKTNFKFQTFLIKIHHFFSYKYLFIFLIIVSLIPNLVSPFFNKTNFNQNPNVLVPFDLAKISKPNSSEVYLGADQQKWETIFSATVIKYLLQFDETGTFNTKEILLEYYKEDKLINLSTIEDGDFISVIAVSNKDAKTVINQSQQLQYQVFNTTVDLTLVNALPPVSKQVAALNATKVTQDEIKNTLSPIIVTLLQEKNQGISQADFTLTVYQKKDANTEINTINMSDKSIILYLIISADSHSVILQGKTNYLTIIFPAIGSTKIDLSIINVLPDQEVPIIVNDPKQVSHAKIINNLQYLINPIVLQLYHKISTSDYSIEIYPSLETTTPITILDLSKEVKIYVQIKANNNSSVIMGKTNYIAVKLLHATSEKTNLAKLIILSPLPEGIIAKDVSVVNHDEIILGLKQHLLNEIQKINYDAVTSDYTYEIYNTLDEKDIVTTVNMVESGVRLYLKVFAKPTSNQLTGKSDFLEVYFPAAIGIKTNLVDIINLNQPENGISASNPSAVTYQEIFAAISPLILATLIEFNPQTIKADYTYQIYNSRNATDIVTTVDMSKSYVNIFVKLTAATTSTHWEGISNYLLVKFPLAVQGKLTISSIATIEAPKEGIITNIPSGVKHNEITAVLDQSVLAEIQAISSNVTSADFSYEIYRDEIASEPITLIDMRMATTVFVVIRAGADSTWIKDQSQIIAVAFPPAIKEKTDLINLTAIEALSQGIQAVNTQAVTYQEIYDAIKGNVFAAVKFLDPAVSEEDFTFEIYNSRSAGDIVTTVDMSISWITLYFKVVAAKNSQELKGITNYLPVKFPLAIK